MAKRPNTILKTSRSRKTAKRLEIKHARLLAHRLKRPGKTK